MKAIVVNRRLFFIVFFSILVILATLVFGSLSRVEQQFLCRKNFIQPLSTGPGTGLFETSIQYLGLIKIKTCVVSVAEQVDSLFPDSASRIKIGFFDRNGFLHIYPARLGGTDLKGQDKGISVCFPSTREGVLATCRNVDSNQALNQLHSGRVIEAEIIFRDAAPWILAAQNQKYRNFFEELKIAIQQGNDFPAPPIDKQFAIQIWQIDLAP